MIVKKNWENKDCVLCYANDHDDETKRGKVVKIGDVVKEMVIDGGSAPYKSGSSGRVQVTENGKLSREYFPGVVGADWIYLDDLLISPVTNK